jgi:hypothetical protein
MGIQFLENTRSWGELKYIFLEVEIVSKNAINPTLLPTGEPS